MRLVKVTRGRLRTQKGCLGPIRIAKVTAGIYILNLIPLLGGGGGMWPKGLGGKEIKKKIFFSQFVQKLEQNDQKCVYYYSLAYIYVM